MATTAVVHANAVAYSSLQFYRKLFIFCFTAEMRSTYERSSFISFGEESTDFGLRAADFEAIICNAFFDHPARPGWPHQLQEN